MKKVLLYSGGTDSWLIDKLWNPDIKLYIDIDGAYSKEEIQRLPQDVQIIDMKFLGKTEDKYTRFVPLRNLYFLMAATTFGDEICYGATLSDAGSSDKRIQFIHDANNLINYCLNGNTMVGNRQIHIVDEFVKLDKYQMVQKYIDNGGTIDRYIEDTFSCHHPVNGKPCMHCKPCYRKFLIGYSFGYKYTNDDERRMIDYLKDNVIPKSKCTSGTYFADRPSEGIKNELAVNDLFKKYNMDWRDWQ